MEAGVVHVLAVLVLKTLVLADRAAVVLAAGLASQFLGHGVVVPSAAAVSVVPLHALFPSRLCLVRHSRSLAKVVRPAESSM